MDGCCDRFQRIADALRLCDISELADRRPGTLSGGQQQRVALSRALAVQPKLLLLDEPFGGLDLITKQSILQQILELKSKWSVVLVTHDPTEVVSLCDSMATLEGGRIAENGMLHEITADPQTSLGKAIVQAITGQASAHGTTQVYGSGGTPWTTRFRLVQWDRSVMGDGLVG